MPTRPPRDRHREIRKSFARHDMRKSGLQSVARCSKLGRQIDSESSCGKVDYGKSSVPFLPADRGVRHAKEGAHRTLCSFCSPALCFMWRCAELNQTSSTSSAFLRKNCASFRMAGKSAHFPGCVAAPQIVKHQRTARDNRLATDR